METTIVWIISKINENMYYCGQKAPSTQYDMFSGKQEKYVPVIWTEELREATRFDNKETAVDIAKLIAHATWSQVKVVKVQVQRTQTI